MHSKSFFQRFAIGLIVLSLTVGIVPSPWAAAIEPPPGSGAPRGTVGGGSRP